MLQMRVLFACSNASHKLSCLKCSCISVRCVQGVGKSCLVLRYVRGQFDPNSKVTVGAAFMSHSVHLPDGTTVKFEIW